MKERARAEEKFKEMICIRCKQVGNAVDLVKHAKKECVCFVNFTIVSADWRLPYRHGLSVVTEGDVTLQMKLGRDSYLFRMWPPR